MSADLPLLLNSSWLRATYNIGQGKATVTFPNGDEREYSLSVIGVINWLRADSPGAYFNSEIKGQGEPSHGHYRW